MHIHRSPFVFQANPGISVAVAAGIRQLGDVGTLHPHDVQVLCYVKGYMLAGGRVTIEGGVGARFAIPRDDEETVVGGLEIEVLVKPGNITELDGGGGSLVVEGKDVSVADAAAISGAVEDLEGGLAAVLAQEKVTGRGDPAPGAADGATTEEGFRGQTYEDLPGENFLREATEAMRLSPPRSLCGLCHGGRVVFHQSLSVFQLRDDFFFIEMSSYLLSVGSRTYRKQYG